MSLPPPLLTGRVRLEGDLDERVVTDRLVKALQAARATRVECEGAALQFDAGLFRWVGSGNPVAVIESGHLRVTRDQLGLGIDYEVSLRQVYVVATIMLLAVSGLLVYAWGYSPIAEAGTLILGWLWLVGGNTIETRLRFPRWLKRSALIDERTVQRRAGGARER